MLNKEIKNLSIATLTDLEKANGKGFIIKNNNVKSKKKNKKRQKEKCEDCKRCYGFCDFLTTSWKLFKEFSADTSIHGIKYLTDKQRHWTEKLFWAIALTLSIVACAYLIYWSLKRCLMSPLLLTFSPKPMNIFEIPFSAVTICPSGGLNPLNEYYNLTSLDSFEIPLKNFTDSTYTFLLFLHYPLSLNSSFTHSLRKLPKNQINLYTVNRCGSNNIEI